MVEAGGMKEAVWENSLQKLFSAVGLAAASSSFCSRKFLSACSLALQSSSSLCFAAFSCFQQSARFSANGQTTEYRIHEYRIQNYRLLQNTQKVFQQQKTSSGETAQWAALSTQHLGMTKPKLRVGLTRGKCIGTSFKKDQLTPVFVTPCHWVTRNVQISIYYLVLSGFREKRALTPKTKPAPRWRKGGH